MAAADVVFFQERLALKEQELGELKSAFHKYKLKQKVKYDNLKKDVTAYCRSTGQSTEEKENTALLQIKVAEMETELEEARARVENLTEELDRSQEQLKDQMTVIRSMENSLKEMSPAREPRDSKFDKKNNNQVVDMDRIQQQMLYKDQRIIELNNNILEKERQILDLQEMCREQGEVADAKKQAMRLVQKKFEEMESRNRREVGTETDPWFPARERDSARGGRAGGASRSLSPGTAVVSRAAGGSSPPPLDPQLGQNREHFPKFDDDDMLPGTSSGFQGRNLDEEISLRTKQKKRVTFDLPPSLAASSINLNEGDDVLYIQLNETITRLTEENAKLMADVEYKNGSLIEARKLLEDSEQEIAKLLRDSKNSNLKARAVAHSRIRELEESLAELNEQHQTEVNRLTTDNDTLRNTREWEVEQNGLLRDHIDKLREKNNKLTAELDATGILNRDLEKKLDESRGLLEGVTTELCEAEELVIFLEDQKESILDDVEKMKEAIFAQDQFIDLLEADIVIYEEHVGLLRDSLGASKVDHRALLRSKAFETKLKALEQEKEQISIKSREEKLKTKALAQKVKLLEDEIEKLTEQLCTRAMGAADDEEMVETCRLLEIRLHESEENMKIERARFEIELAGQRVENKQRLAECEELRFRIYALENQQRREEQYPVGSGRGGNDQHHQHQQQTQLVQQAAVSQETEELRVQVQQQEAKVKELLQNITCLESELDAVRATNFELTDRVKESEELERDYDGLVEKHRHTCVELVSAKEALDKFQAEAVDPRELEALLERATGAEEEVKVLRTELEEARHHSNQTVAVQKELDTAKTELERERSMSQEMQREVLQRNTPSEAENRKALEVQNQQNLQAFEEKIAQLKQSLQSATTKLSESESEKQELRLMLDRVQEMEYVKAVERKEGSSQRLEALMEQNQILEQAAEQYKTAEEQLLTKINDLELEASLAGELSVEMGRVIQQFEKQMKQQEVDLTKAEEKAHAAEMELRLHEMLNEELGRQLDEFKEKEKVQEKRVEELEQSTKTTSEELENRIKEAESKMDKKQSELVAAKKKNSLLIQQIQDLEEKLTTSVNQTTKINVELKERKKAVQQVQGELEEMRQEQGEQEIQRVVHQVQHAGPAPQGSIVSQHHHNWNWGHSGYSPPYLMNEVSPQPGQEQGHSHESQTQQQQPQHAGHSYQEQQYPGSHVWSQHDQPQPGQGHHQPPQSHVAQLNQQSPPLQDYSESYVQNYAQQHIQGHLQQTSPTGSQGHGHGQHEHHHCHAESREGTPSERARKEGQLTAAKEENSLLTQQIQNLEEQLTTSVNQTTRANVELKGERETVRQFERGLKDSRQEQGEQEIQRVVHQVQHSAHAPQGSQVSQHHHNWNWGQAGYAPPYLQPAEVTVSHPGAIEVTVSPQDHSHPAHHQMHVEAPRHHQQVHPYQTEATVSQPSVQGHGHSHSHGGHSHEPQGPHSGHGQHQPSQSQAYQQNQPLQDYSDSFVENYPQEHIQEHLQQPSPTGNQGHGHDHHEHHHHHHETHAHFVEPVAPQQQETEQQQPPAPRVQSRESFVKQVQSENELLRQCVNETIQLREDMTHDVEKLLELKNELEVAVDALKGEIWTLNGQLKASILDRENLQDRVVELDTSLTEEKKKVASLDVELSEQQELIDKATRQAAEAENESNRRLAECHEMESRRIELEQAYSQLTEYYNQLQAAYNLLYAQQQQGVEIGAVQQAPNIGDPALVVAINFILEELSLPVVDEDIRSKLNAIREKIREKIAQVEQLHSAVTEQAKVARALESRLEAVEEEKETNGGEQLELKNKVHQLEGDLEWKQEECDSLRRQVDELQHALNSIIVNDGDDALATSRLRTELAILAARLATRQADVDSLFRTNAELAHTNVRLQNELDEREDGIPGGLGGGGDDAQILAEKVQELEQKLAEWTDSKEEIERLKNIEKILNNRILSLEDQLLEKEEQMQEMEDQMMENQGSSGDSDRLRVLEQANSAVIVELEELRQERDTLRANIQIMEKDREIRKEEAKMKEQELKSREDEVNQYEEELDDLKAEILVMKQKIQEKEDQVQVERVQQTQSAWGDWEEKEKEEEEEEEDWKAKVEQLEKELKRAQKKNEDLEKALDSSQEAKWGWEQGEGPEDARELREELDELKERLDETQEEHEILQSKYIEREEELLRMKAASALKGIEKQSQEDAGELRAELEQLKGRLDAAQEEQETLKLRNTQLEEELAFLLEANQKKETEETWGDWEEKKESSENVEDLKNRLEIVQQEQEELKLRNLDLEEELASLLEANKNVQKEEKKAGWEQEAKYHAEEVKQLQDELEEVKSLLDSSQQVQEDLKLKNYDLAEGMLQMKGKEEAKEEKGDAWGDWDEKKSDSGDVSALQREVEDLKSRLDESQQEQEQLEVRNMELAEELTKMKEKQPAEDSWGEDWNEKGPAADEDLQKLQDEVAELRRRLDQNQQEEEDLKLRNTELEEEMEALLESNQKLMASNETKMFLEEIKELESRLDKSQQEQEDLKLKNMELGEELEALNQKLQEKQEEVPAWNEWDQKEPSEEDSRLREELEDVKKRLDSAQEEQETLKLRNTELEEELAFLLEANQKKEQTKEDEAWGDWEDKKSEFEAIERQQERVNTLTSTVETLQQDHRVLLARNVQLEKEIADLLKETEVKPSEEAWGDWDEKQKEDEVEKVAHLQEEVVGLKRELLTRDQKLQEIMEEVNDAKEELEEKEKRIQYLEEQAAKAPEKKEENWGEWSEGNEELEQLKIDNEELRTRLEGLERSENETRLQLQKLKASSSKPARKDWSHEQNEAERLKFELAERDRERSKLEAVIMRVEKENEELMGQLEETHVEEKREEKRKGNDDMAYTLFEFQKEIQRLREENSRLQVTVSQNVQSSDDTASMSEELVQKQKEELEETQNKLSALTTTLQSVENNYLATREEAQSRQVELEERIHSLEKELDSAQSGVDELAAKEERMTALEKRLAEVMKQNNLLKESEGRLLESVDEYGAVADKNQEEVDRLQKVVNSLEKERADLLEEVERLKIEIERLNASSQSKEEDPILKRELEALRTERDSLKSKLTAMEGKLAEIEKEKSQIKAAYDQLRAKIQARRAAAAAGGGSAASSRAPSRASVASIGEIREDPVEELTYQTTAIPTQTLQVQSNHNSYSQDIDDRVQQFLEEVKEFVSRVDSIATVSQENLEEVGKSLDHLMARRGPKRKPSSPVVESSDPGPRATEIAIQTETDPASLNLEQVEEMEKTILDLELQLEKQNGELEEAASRYQDLVNKVEENDVLSQKAINDLVDCNRVLEIQLRERQLEVDHGKVELKEKYDEMETIALENEKLQLAILTGLEENRGLSNQLATCQTELRRHVVQIQELEDQLSRVEAVSTQGAPILEERMENHEEEVEKTLLETIDKLETDLDDVGMEKETILEEWDKLKKALEDSRLELGETRMRNIELEENVLRLEHDISHLVVKEMEQKELEQVKEELNVARMEQDALKLENSELEDELSAMMAVKQLENDQLQAKEVEVKQYEEELDDLKAEILVMKQKIQEKEDQVQVERVQQTQSAWGDWEEKEKEEEEEEEDWKAKVEQLEKELKRAQKKNEDLEKALDSSQEAKWGWEQGEGPEDARELREELDELKERLDETQEEHEILQSKYIEREEELLRMKAASALKGIEKQSQEDAGELRAELEQLKGRLDAAQEEQETLKLRNTQLEEELAFAEQKRRLWIEEQQKELKELVGHLENSQEEQEQLILKNTELEEELANLQEEVLEKPKWEQGTEPEEFAQLQEELVHLKERLDSVQEEQENLKLRNTQLEEELVKAKETIGHKEEEKRDEEQKASDKHRMWIVTLQKELAELVGHLENSQQEQEELLLKNAILQEELAKLQETRAENGKGEEEAGWNDWEEKEEKQEQRVDSQSLEQTVDEQEELRSRIAQLGGELAHVTEKAIETCEIGCETDFEDSNEEIERLEGKLEDAKQLNCQLEAENSSHQVQYQALRLLLEDSQNEQEILIRKNELFEKALEDIEEVSKAFAVQENRADKLEKELKETRNEVKTREEELEQRNVEREELEGKIKELVGKLEVVETLEDENSRLAEQLSSNQRELASFTMKLRELEMDQSRIDNEQVQKSATDDDNSEIIEALQKENEHLEEQLLEMSEKLRNGREEAKKTAEELEEQWKEAKRMRSEIGNLTRDVDELSVERDQLIQENDSQTQRLQAEVARVSQLSEELEASRSKILQLEAQINQLEHEKKESVAVKTREMEEKTVELQEVNQRITQMEKELEKRQEETEGLHSQIDHLTWEISQLNADKEELLQGQASSHLQLQDEVALLTAETNQLKDQNSQLEAEKQQTIEENTRQVEEKALEIQKIQEDLNQQAAEWKNRFELAYADLCQLHPAVQQAQEHASQLLVQNTELQRQLEQKTRPPVEEEQLQTSAIYPVESAPAILQLEHTAEAGPLVREESSSETRISIEDEEANRLADAAEEEEDETSSDTRPLLSEFDDFIGQATNSHFIRASAPLTQPLVRQLRAIWGRRAFRPYFRYFLSLYFVFVHFLVFSSWFNPC